MKKRWMLLAIPMVAALACMNAKTDANATTDTNPKTLSADVKAVVESTTTAFHQALRTNDSTGFLSFISDDVIIHPPGEPSVKGMDGTRAWLSGFLKQYQTTKLTLGDREVFVGDGWATELGSYEWVLKPTAGGADVTDRGHYMQVWKLSPDGKWKFAREIWNSAGAPSA